MSDMISAGGVDTASYQARDERKRRIDPATSPRALMDDALVVEAPAPVEVDRTPVITQAMKEENLRRVRAGAVNTLVTINPDGTRSYHEDRIVRDGDGMQDTVTHGQRSDRGDGTADSLDMLSKEGAVKTDKLLSSGPPKRDSSGRFVSKGKSG